MTSAVLLLLMDGRFPAGGHAHSGGLEAAVAAGLVRGLPELYEWLTGRLVTLGSVEAAFAAAAWSNAQMAVEATGVCACSASLRSKVERRWISLDRELVARTISPAQRAASRAQGRGLVRAAQRCWSSDVIEEMAEHLQTTTVSESPFGVGPMWPIAFGATGYAAGLSVEEVTLGACSASIQGPAWSSTRLLGLDPLGVADCLARLAPAIEKTAEGARQWSDWALSPGELPCASAPLLEIGAEDHAKWEVRLFAS